MRHHTLVACAVLLALAACTRAGSAPSSPVQARAGGGEAWSVGADGIRAQDRLLVRRASLDVEVRDPTQFAERARTLTERLGGFVAHSSRTGNGDPDDGQVQLVLRLPSDSLDAALDSLGALGKVRSRMVSSDDVTEQVVDLQARVTNLRASRDRLRQLVGQATAVADVVAVERELTRVQGELDALEARLEYLRSSVSLAEITVTARPALRLGPLGLLFGGVFRLVGALFVLP
jgi:hypothetical protein